MLSPRRHIRHEQRRLHVSFSRYRWLVIGLLMPAVSLGLMAGAAGAARTSRADAPAFSVVDLQGTTHDLQAYRGQIVVLHFWATWCGYCRGEIPKITALHTAFKSKNVVVLAVSVDDSVETLRAFVQQRRLPYPVIADAQNARPLHRAYGVFGVPTTYLIDRDGAIAERLSGPADYARRLERLLKQPASGMTEAANPIQPPHTTEG